MTISVTETETGANLSEHGHETEWSVDVEISSIPYIIERLQTILRNKKVGNLTQGGELVQQ